MTNVVSEKTLDVTVIAAYGHPATENQPEKEVGTRMYTASVDLKKRRSETFAIDVPEKQHVLRWQLVPAGQDIIDVGELNKQYVFPPSQPGEVLGRQESLTITRVGRDYALSYQRLQ